MLKSTGWRPGPPLRKLARVGRLVRHKRERHSLGLPRLGPAPANPAQASSFNNQTVRMIVHTSIGGTRVRVELSNAYGTAPLTSARRTSRCA